MQEIIYVTLLKMMSNFAEICYLFHERIVLKKHSDEKPIKWKIFPFVMTMVGKSVMFAEILQKSKFLLCFIFILYNDLF